MTLGVPIHDFGGSHGESKGTFTPMPRLAPKKSPALLRGYEAHHCPLTRPAIRAFFLGGKHGIGGGPW